MRKFWALMRKELKELLTPQALLPLLIGVVVFILVGSLVGGTMKDAQENQPGGAEAVKLAVLDADKTPASQAALDALGTMGYQVMRIDAQPDTAFAEAKSQGFDSVLIIKEGFAKSIEENKPAAVETVSQLRGTSIASMMNPPTAVSAGSALSEAVSTMLIAQKTQITDTAFLKNPVTVSEVTQVGEKSAALSSMAVMSFILNNSMLVPLVVFILVIFASQMTASSIANEKGDKTLETLLTMPVPRVSILSAKMASAGIVALLYAVVYMFGMTFYINGFSGGAMAEGAGEAGNAALATLGLSLSPLQYVVVGLSLFLTILIAIAISTILGALVEDIKGIQSAIMPLMFAVMIPFFVTMFTDINSLPFILKALIYLIPFTHTFTVMGNLMFGNALPVALGLGYQVIVFAAVMFIAVRIFTSDKLFTMKLSFQKKKRKIQL